MINYVYGVLGKSKVVETGEVLESYFTSLFSTEEEAETALKEVGYESHKDEHGTYFTLKANGNEFELEHDLEMEKYVVKLTLPKKTNGEIENEK